MGRATAGFGRAVWLLAGGGALVAAACSSSGGGSSHTTSLSDAGATGSGGGSGGGLDGAAATGDGPTFPTGGGGDASTAQCSPASIAGYTPKWHPPRAPEPACADQDLDAIVADCFATTATVTTCQSFENSNPICWGCMVTADTSLTWGAVVASTLTPFTYGNFAGCLALETQDESDSGCGALQQAARVCTEYACSGPQCPSDTPDEADAVYQCVHDAAYSVCASYQNASVACVQGLKTDGGAAAAAVAKCSQGSYPDQPTYYRALGVVFCGMQNATGGGDGGGASGSSGGNDAAGE